MIRVAGYCRVSTDRDDQANSFEAQQRYFREYIAQQPDWELQGIYADEGISGTGTKKRAQFNRMMNDAFEGKFQLIITKEVSRFSRNILDTIACTRALKEIGVGVLFLTDRIHTLDPEAEMLLSIMASLAQEESRKTSARVVWGQTRQMERGVVFGRSMLGYDVKDGQMTVNPEGAELVRLIFHKYAIEQVGTSQIARFLTREGFLTYRGSTQWKPAAVIKILKNEKYVGDLIQKKTYTPDYLTHEKRRNTGQVPLVTIENHHEPIVSRELWNLTQLRLQKNNKHGPTNSGHSNRYVFSGRIRCGVCGASFICRYKTRKDGTRIRRWCCPTAGCSIGKTVRDDDALQMLKTAVRSLQADFDAVVRTVTELAMDAIPAEQTARDGPEKLLQELQQLQRKKEAVMDAYFSREIPKEDMALFREKYAQQAESLQQRIDEAQKRKNEGQDFAALRLQIQLAGEAILNGDDESEVFSKTILDSLTVFPDRHMELRLNRLPLVFHFS